MPAPPTGKPADKLTHRPSVRPAGDLTATMAAAQVTAARRLVPLQGLLAELGAAFTAAGFTLALVGGPVRDALLGRASLDLDFATDARPDDTARLLRSWGDAHWEIGRDFGTVGARRGEHVVEVTTYRADTYQQDSRNPEVRFGDSLEGDLSRRDFTVNAMALKLPELTFVDPHHGLADLARGVLRTPSAPQLSFGDDPLRMLRAARFTAQLGFTVIPEVAAAMTGMAARIEIVSAERVQAELVKLMLAPDPRPGVELLVATGLAERILPELPALKLEIDEHHRHKDVYQHSLTVLEQAIALEDEPDLTLRLAALLHDIGKPATRRFEPGGGVSFHHHESVGARLATRRLKALRFEKHLVDDVARLVELHLRFHGYGDGGWTDSAVRRYVTDAGPLLERLHRLTRSDCTTRNARKAARLAASYDDLERRIARLREQEELDAVRPDLDGNDIMRILGIPPGRDVGAAWAFLKELRLERGPVGAEAAERALLNWWENYRG